MALQFDRPIPVYDPGRSLLANDHYQLGYVTNDIDRAVRVFQERFGVDRFRENDNDLPDGGKVCIRAVWIGNMMYELCCGTGPSMGIYTEWAPEDGSFVLRLHHFGYLVESDEDWNSLENAIAKGGWAVRSRSDIPGFVRTRYVDAPELGHYLEFVQPGEGLLERMKATPVA